MCIKLYSRWLRKLVPAVSAAINDTAMAHNMQNHAFQPCPPTMPVNWARQPCLSTMPVNHAWYITSKVFVVFQAKWLTMVIIWIMSSHHCLATIVHVITTRLNKLAHCRWLFIKFASVGFMLLVFNLFSLEQQARFHSELRQLYVCLKIWLLSYFYQKI